MHPSERQFADFLESNGKTFVYHPPKFKLTMEGFKSYQVDFYCPEDNIYYEVKKNLTYRDVEKMLIFKKEYPALILKVVSPNGFPFYSNSSHIILEKIFDDLNFFLSKDILDFTLDDYEEKIVHFLRYRINMRDDWPGNRTKKLQVSRERLQQIERIKKKIGLIK